VQLFRTLVLRIFVVVYSFVVVRVAAFAMNPKGPWVVIVAM
jgi:hypothetical protein